MPPPLDANVEHGPSQTVPDPPVEDILDGIKPAFLWFMMTSTLSAFLGLLLVSDADHLRLRIAALVFFWPVLAILTFGICYVLTNGRKSLIYTWGALIFIPGYMYSLLTLPSEIRDLVISLIILSPINFMAFTAIMLTGFLILYIAFVALRNSFYAMLGWYWVFCLPRFRTRDPFAQCKLCLDCRVMISRSGLIFGRRTLLTRASEDHRYVLSPEHRPLLEHHVGASRCHLCLLFQLEREKYVHNKWDEALSHGGFSSRSSLLDFAIADTTLKISTRSWGLSLETPLLAKSTAPEYDIEVFMGRWRESRAKFNIVQRPLSPLLEPEITSTASPSVISIAKQWLISCSKHRACQSLAYEPFVPTRLLGVGRSEEPLACFLVDRIDLCGKPVRYFALSHCWGDDVPVTLTVENYSRMKGGIAVAALSKTFRDAISATRALGVEYLWIDSLCIIQNSLDGCDWNRESMLMMHVFANAACTLSATASISSQGGCFRNRPGELYSCKLATSRTSELRIEVPKVPEDWRPIHELFRTRVEAAPLTRRGWVFQERLLSRRIIHFCSDMVLFECNTLQASERYTQGIHYETLPYLLVGGHIQGASSRQAGSPRRRPTPVRVDVQSLATSVSPEIMKEITSGNYEDHSATRGIRGALDVLLSVHVSTELTLQEMLTFNERWYELIEAYSRCSLTKMSDKLVAIAGVAGLVEKMSQAEYVAGLWSNVAPELGLLWRVVGDRAKRQEVYIAPTWSWTSLDGPVRFLPSLETGQVERVRLHSHVQKAAVRYREGTKSHIDSGQLEVQGLLLKCRVTGHSRDTEFGLDLPADDPVSATWSFWPDWEDRDSLLDKNKELFALLVMSGRTHERNYWPTVYGLVLRTNGDDADGVMNASRVGTFKADGLTAFVAIEQWLARWETRQLRIV